MWIFGGFCYGHRTNQMYKYTFSTNIWEKVKFKTKDRPCPRAGHTAVLYTPEVDIHGSSLYVFGGKAANDKKLNDVWKLNFNTMTWSEIKVDETTAPCPRSGHSA